MLSKKIRTNVDEVENVFKNSHSYSTEHITLRAYQNTTTKVGFVVPKRLKLSAVNRNKLRRRGYSGVRHLLDHISSPHTLVFFFKKGAETLSLTRMETELKELLDKLL